MSKLRIDEVFTKNGLYPMLVNFQNGYLSEDFKSQSCCVFRNEKTDEKTVALDVNGIVYAGPEEEEPLGKTLLLARNKKTGKVRLIEVGSVQLKPVMGEDSEESQLLETNYLELSRKFGSKKQRQKMEHNEKLRVNVDTVTEQMQNVTKTVSVNKLDLSNYNKMDSDDFYIPPIDRTADKPENVYEIRDILTEEEYDKIYSELEGKDYESNLTPFIKGLTSNRKLTKRQTVLAVYASCLIKACHTLMKDIVKKSFVACPNSSTLNEVILTKFFTNTNGKLARPTPYKDKALCHAIVFALLINNLKFPLAPFCKDSKMTEKTAITKIRVTAASIVTSEGRKAAQLKVPLTSKISFKRKSAKF